MVSKLKFILILILIFSLLFVNFSYCASGSLLDPYYVNISNNTLLGTKILYMQDDISTIRGDTGGIMNNVERMYLQQAYDFTSSVHNTDDYIINEQNYIQDLFIYCCNSNEDLKEYVRTHFNFDIYGIILGDGRVSIRIYDLSTNGNNYTTMDDASYNKSYSYNISQSPYGRTYQVNYDTTSINSVGSVVITLSDYTFTFNPNSILNNVKIPICCLCYKSASLYNYLHNLRGLDEATNQTVEAIKESTDRILSEDSAAISDTGVSDSTTDSSPDLQGTFNTMSSAFTSRNTSSKTFVFTLPNGQNYNFTLNNNLLTNMLRGYGNTFYAFYQAIFWCVFGGYVLFDFKRIINKFKGGDIDTVVSSSSPIDNVVKASIS